LSRPSHRTWQRDAELGANTLTIATGHTVDAMRFVAGDLQRLSAVVATQAKHWLDTGTNALLDVTSPDNVLLSGRLVGGAVASVHVGAIPFAGSGYRMEIYGRDGTLVATGADSPQLSAISLYGAKGDNTLEPIPVPRNLTIATPGIPPGEAVNVGQMYTLFARAIREGEGHQPTFETAVDLHHLTDAIRQASNDGREAAFETGGASEKAKMKPGTSAGGERFDVTYLILSGTTTAARCPELLRGLVGLGFATVIVIPTPNASRVIAPRDLADVEGVQVVQSYFDLAIRPRPPRGVVLFAPCSFNSLNKLARGIADNLALSVAAEAIGRGTPVIVGPSLNAPLLNHPQAQASLTTLPNWGVTIVQPVDEGEGPRLAPTTALLDAVRPYVRR